MAIEARRDQFGRKKKPRRAAAILANALESADLQRIFNDGALAAPPGSPFERAPAGLDTSYLSRPPIPRARTPELALPYGKPPRPDPLSDIIQLPAPINPFPKGGVIDSQELGGIQGEELPVEEPEINISAAPVDRQQQAQPAQQGGFMQRVGRWMEPGSPTSMALLSAGLGILANNTGHYGQAGPAIGRGGLMGVNTFLQLKRQQEQAELNRERLAGSREQRELYKRQVDAQIAAQERANQAEARKVQAEERKMRAAQSLRSSLSEADQRMFDADPEEFMKVFAKDRESGRMALLREEALKIAGDDPQERAFAISAPDKYIEYKATLKGDIEKRRAGATNVTQTVEQRELDKQAMQSLTEQQKIQTGQEDALYSVLDAEAILDKGIYSGKWADLKRGLEKGAGSILGTDTTKSANTEEFMAHIGNTVIPMLTAFGGNDSNEELRYLRSVMGGDIEMEEQALRNILKSVQRKIRRGIIRHNESLRRVGEEVKLPGNVRQISPPSERQPGIRPSSDGWTPPPGITR